MLVAVGDAGSSDGALHGFLRTRSGRFELIDVPGLPVPCTTARWINERGDIVGFFGLHQTIDECSADPPRFHGFLLRQGSYSSLDFPGSVNTTALGSTTTA